jgi:hypothetical protein
MKMGIAEEGIFNEAALKMRRIDENWQTINHLRTNMLDYNYFFKKYNYEVIISMLFSQCNEILDLMSSDDLRIFNFFRDNIISSLEKYSVHQKKCHYSFGEVSSKTIINKSNWNFMRNLIFMFEDFTRMQLGKHGVSNPRKDDPSKAVYMS